MRTGAKDVAAVTQRVSLFQSVAHHLAAAAKLEQYARPVIVTAGERLLKSTGELRVPSNWVQTSTELPADVWYLIRFYAVHRLIKKLRGDMFIHNVISPAKVPLTQLKQFIQELDEESFECW